ncbi:MAG: hypothetical protein P1V97_38105 [Planctomycetota bacterium]|nr:hypothetical protein [Planctomycetota bacterium]
MEPDIKMDTQSRTSMQGFMYSRGDPANSTDPNPTDFSYIDFAFAGQLAALDRKLRSSTLENRAEVEEKRVRLLHTIDERAVRKSFFRTRVQVSRAAPEDLEEPGEVLAFTVCFSIIAGFTLVMSTVNPSSALTIVVLATTALSVMILGNHLDFDPYGEVEVFEEGDEEASDSSESSEESATV